MRLRIRLNAPLILAYTLASTAVLLLTPSSPSLRVWFVAPGAFMPQSVRFWLTLFSHVIGHANWNQLLESFAVILLIGPGLESRHGRSGMALIILVTAGVTGLLGAFFSPSAICGSSGVAFAMIILSSFVSIRTGDIPVTFVLVLVLYLAREATHMLAHNEENHLLHLIGGACGSFFGDRLYRAKGQL